jgi:hypothetical protein
VRHNLFGERRATGHVNELHASFDYTLSTA